MLPLTPVESTDSHHANVSCSTVTFAINLIPIGTHIGTQAGKLTPWGPGFLLEVISHYTTLKHTPLSVLSDC